MPLTETRRHARHEIGNGHRGNVFGAPRRLCRGTELPAAQTGHSVAVEFTPGRRRNKRSRQPCHLVEEFAPHAPSPIPVLPEWSPVKVFGGYGAPLDIRKAAR